jgi:hypothetical protein
MTSGRYFEICRLLYNVLEGEDYEQINKDVSPKALYRMMSDGRDGGLSTLKEDSPEQFEKWLNANPDRHAWQFADDIRMCSCRMNLCVERHDNGRYYVKVSAYASRFVKEEMECIIALLKAGYPLDMEYPRKLARKLQGDYTVAINPQGASFPSDYVSENNIVIDEIGDRKLPEDCPEELMKLITWLPVEANA